MSIAEGKFELDLMRGYEESFRNRMSRVVSLSYDCVPLNLEQYSQKVIEVFQSMKGINPNDKDLGLYDEIILGKIEGQPAGANFKQIIESIVGEVSEQKLKGYLKQKSQQRSFGATNKDKNCCIRQVKKLQSLQKYFDVQQITKKRKYNKLYSAAIKSLAKYLELYSKILQTDPSTFEKPFEYYNIYIKEQKKFAQFVKEQQESKHVLEKPIIVEEVKPQAEPERLQVIEEEHKIAQTQQVKQKIQQNKKQPEPQAKNPRKSKSKKKQTKPQDPSVLQINSAQAAEKEKLDSAEKQRKEKQEKEKQLKKKKKQQQKIVKKPTINLLTEYGFKKQKIVKPIKKTTIEEPSNIVPIETPQQLSPQAQVKQQVLKVQSIWDTFGQNPQTETQTNFPQISCLRQQFRAYRMQNEQYNPEPHYTNIIMTLSTIEYFDYFMHIEKDVNFGEPFRKIRKVMYFEDESEEFEGENADFGAEDNDEEDDDDDELSVGNHTILSNDYLSNQEISSCQVNDLHLKIEYGEGRQWIINFVSRATSMYSEDELKIYDSFSMISLEIDQQMPLRLDEEAQTVQFIMTSELWRDVYRSAHGHYGTKDSIVKDLSTLLPGVSKNWIDSMLRERSQKIVNQRYIKKDFIDDIKQKIPEIDTILEKVLDDRNQELRKIRAEKNQQKDLKLQKDILECTGSRYIVNLIKQLKEKGYKQMRRNQLIEFINERKGEEWDKIKAEMNTMSRPIDELIRNMPASERIDEEVEVDDDEFRKIRVQGKQEGDSATKDKNGKNSVENEKSKKLKQKKSEQNKEEKGAKMKKRRNKQKNSGNMYEKTKPINRARNTKNSLKTGIPSIDELKKQKEEEKQNEEKQQNLQENEGNEENEDDSEEQNSLNHNGPEAEIYLEIIENNEGENIKQDGENQKNVEGQDVEEQKNSIEKSVVLSEANEKNVWSSKLSSVKESETAEKSERKEENLVTFSNIEQQ